MNKKHLLFLCCLCIFSVAVSFSFAEEKALKKTSLKGLDQLIVQSMDEWKVPGLAVAIVKDEKVIYSKGYGFRDKEKELKVTPETLFAIGSCTKAFTTTALGILVDEGKLEWDRPLREYLPTFKMKDLFASERMTPRDLLCHRSGLPQHDDVWYNRDISRKQIFESLQYLEPSEEFRTKWEYQNLMYVTAGYLVDEISGISWEEFVRERIFNPLGMVGSNFSVEDSKKAPDFSAGYSIKDDEVVEMPLRNLYAAGPAGSINSSIKEMTNWVLLNLNKGKFGETQVISEKSLKELHSPQMIMSKDLPDDEYFYSLYGLGWSITAYRGHLLVSHRGGIDGFMAHVSFMPKDNIGMVILTNMNPNPLLSIISNTAYDRLLALDPISWIERTRQRERKSEEMDEKAKAEKDKFRIPDTEPSHPIKDYTGEFEHPAYGVIQVKKKGDQLFAIFSSIEYPLRHYHYDIFEMNNWWLLTNWKVTFFTDKKGGINRLSIDLEPKVDDIVFERVVR